MTFCTNCGFKNKDQAKFCVKCGQRMTQPEQLEQSQQSGQLGRNDVAAQAVVIESGGNGLRKRAGIIIAAVVAVALVVCAGLTLTYRAGIWGGKIMPNPSTFTAPKGKDLTANIVAKQLNDQGIQTKIKTVYSGTPKGGYVDTQGANPGDRVKSGTTVTVRESKGPGVPEGTTGKKATDVVAALRDMGVPVHYKQVPVSDGSSIREGSVALTYPADGQPVTDTDKGIYVGVASKDADGVPEDIIGEDRSAAESELSSRGYSVSWEPRFSSKKYVGKVSGYDESDDDSVTLYYGVDAKDADKVLGIGKKDDSLAPSPSGLAGSYCNKAGDCVTLKAEKQYSGSASDALYEADETSIGSGNDNSLLMCDAVQSAFCSATPMSSDKGQGFLYQKKYGAVELIPRQSFLQFCGDSFEPDGSAVPCSSTPQWKMRNMYVFFPAGADIKGLEDSGYFDSSALSAAKKQGEPDSDRPFLIMRDVSKISGKKTSTAKYNPFVPSSYTNNDFKMTPAPSAESAYYLVEGEDDLDWDALSDADVKGTQSKTSDDSAAKSTAKDQADKSAQLFAKIAGNYRYSWTGEGSGYTDMRINDDGSFEGAVNEADPGPGDSMATAPRKITKFHGSFKSIKTNDAGGYDLTCDAQSFSIANSDEKESGGFSACSALQWYPADTPFDDMQYADAAKNALSTADPSVLSATSQPNALLVNAPGNSVFEELKDATGMTEF